MNYRLILMLWICASSLGTCPLLTGEVLAAPSRSALQNNHHKASDTKQFSPDLSVSKAAVLEIVNLDRALVKPFLSEVNLIQPFSSRIALRTKASSHAHLAQDDLSAQSFLANRPPHGPPPPPPPPPPGRPPHRAPPPPPPPPPPPF